MNCAESLTTRLVEVQKVTNKPEKLISMDKVEYNGKNYQGCEVLSSLLKLINNLSSLNKENNDHDSVWICDLNKHT